MKRIFYSIVLLLSLVNISQASVWYVNAAATGSGSGLNWLNACTDIATAISNSSSGDEIWVASGVYKPSTSVSSIYYNLKAGVAIYAGFNGSETLLSQRDIILNPTIISGDIGVLGFPNDNTYHLFNASNLNVLATVDGFTIKDAVSYAIGIFHSFGYYGGAAVINNSNVKFANCAFLNHVARGGAAIFSTYSNLTFEHCTFNGNNANYDNGGAIWAKGGLIVITDCDFKSNSTTSTGGSTSGGAIYLSEGMTSMNVTIDRCLFTNNSTFLTGSAIKAFGYTGGIKLSNCLIVGNYSKYGSVVDLEGSSSIISTHTAQLTNCTVAMNSADTSLLAYHPIQLYATFKKVLNCIVWQNTCSTPLGTGYQVSNSIIEGGYASGMNIINTNPQFTNPPSFTNTPFVGTPSDFQLQLLSPGIDSGDNSFVASSLDFNDSTRIQNSNVDIGAFETTYCTLPLNINSTTSDTICYNQSATFTANSGNQFLWNTGATSNSISINTSGLYSLIAIDTVSKCRGIDTVQLTVLPNNIHTTQVSICSGQGFTFPSGVFYPAIYSPIVDTSIIPASTGCDSTIITDLSINPTYSINQISYTCQGSSFTYPDGITVFNVLAPQSHTSYLTSSLGCDSNIITSLNLYPTFTSFDTVSVCRHDSYLFPDGYQLISADTSVSHINHLVSAQGCDSIVTIALAVTSIDTSVTQTGAAIQANAVGLSYQWFNCDSHSPILGAINQMYLAITNGNYGVSLFDGVCYDTSSCFQVKGLMINETKQSGIEIYPNPTSNKLIITLNEAGNEIKSIQLKDILGQEIISTTLQTKIENNKSSLELSHYADGIYLITITLKDGQSITQKVYKKS